MVIEGENRMANKKKYIYVEGCVSQISAAAMPL